MLLLLKIPLFNPFLTRVWALLCTSLYSFLSLKVLCEMPAEIATNSLGNAFYIDKF